MPRGPKGEGRPADVIGAAVMTRFRLFRGRAGPAIGSQVADARRIAANLAKLPELLRH
jgi:hypothetical protein